jgi:ligand-binding sensor domain-containing protein
VIVFAQTPQRVANLQLHLDYPINHIIQDPKGVLWLATDNGLVRYDGSTTEVYTHDPNNPQSLPMNRLYCLWRDTKTGLIWIGTGNSGLVCFDPKAPKDKAFTTYSSLPNDVKTVGGNAIFTLTMDENRHLWIGGDNAMLTELDLETRQFTRYTEGVDSTIHTIIYGGNGLLWFGTRRQSLSLYDTRQHKIVKRWEHNHLLHKSFHIFNNWFNNVNRVVLNADNQSLWYLYAPLGLMNLELKTDKMQNYPLGFKPLNPADLNELGELCFDSEGKLWVGHTKEGLVVFNPKTGQVERRLIEESEVAKRLLPFRVNRIFNDMKTHQMWIGTSKGLFSYSPIKNNYTQLSPLNISSKIISISENLFDKERSVWILTDKEVLKMDGRTHREITRFRLPSEIVANQWSGLYTQPSGVYIHSVNHISRINEQTRKIDILPITYDINGFVDDTLPNGEPIHWISTYNAGLFRQRQNGKLENFTHFPNNTLIGVYRTMEGKIWICTDNSGLIRLKDKENLSFDHFLNNPKMANSLPDNIPTCFYTDTKKRLWLGTASNGLVWIENPNAEQPIFHQYSLNKAANPFISGIHEDADGNLWANILGEKPYVFNPNTGESCRLKGDGSDILPNHFADKIIIGQGQSGTWLTNTEGVVFIDKTKDFVFPKRSLPINFTGLTIFDKDETGRLTDSTLQLSYRENFFSIKFSAVNFEGNTQYRYKLDGIDKNWVRIGSRNIAYYTDLSAGTYTFRVRASVGVESDDDAETTLQIVITPPFWQTVWFRLLALFAIGSVLFWLYKNRLRRIKYEAELKQKEAEIKQKEAETAQLRAEFQQKIAETELSALRAQMNPHFIFNCLNSLNLYILENHVDLASDYLQRFSRLIRLVLENSRLERIPLSNEVEALKLYMVMEGMRFKDKLTFEISIDPLIDMEMTTIPPLLLQPFLENAIWHGLMHKLEGGTIWLNITQPTESVVHAEIIDNGIGRAASTKIKSKSATRQKSFGMKVTSERIEAINQIYHTATKVVVTDLFDKNGQPSGTQVIVNIPI